MYYTIQFLTVYLFQRSFCVPPRSGHCSVNDCLQMVQTYLNTPFLCNPIDSKVQYYAANMPTAQTSLLVAIWQFEFVYRTSPSCKRVSSRISSPKFSLLYSDDHHIKHHSIRKHRTTTHPLDAHRKSYILETMYSR